MDAGFELRRFTVIGVRKSPKLYQFGIAIFGSEDNFSRKSGRYQAFMNAQSNPIAKAKLDQEDNLKGLVTVSKYLASEVAAKFHTYKRFQECYRERIPFPGKDEFVKNINFSDGRLEV